MPRSYEIKYTRNAKPNIKGYPGSAFATSDLGKMVGLSSSFFSLLSTVSTSIDGYVYDAFGVLRGLPNGTCTAKSTQYVIVAPVYEGDVLKCLMSSNFSTSGTPAASSDIGKTVGLTQNGPLMPGLSTAGTLLTQGALRGIIQSVPSTAYVNVLLTAVQLFKKTTA
jgi:hypothetical protein